MKKRNYFLFSFICLLILNSVQMYSNQKGNQTNIHFNNIKNKIDTMSGYVKIVLSTFQEPLYVKILTRDSIGIVAESPDKVKSTIKYESMQEVVQLFIEVKTQNGDKFFGYWVDEKDSLLFLSYNGASFEIPIISISEKNLVILEGDMFCEYCYEIVHKFYPPKLKISTPNKEVKKENKQDTMKLHYPVLGLSLITPGGLNLVIGYNFDKYGIRTSSGFVMYPELLGMQMNFLRNLVKEEHFELNVSLAPGYISEPRSDFVYLAGLVDFNFYGLFLETGLAYGSGNYSSNVQLLFQIGYVYRFN